MSQLGSLPPPPNHTGYLPLGSCRTFEGILLSPHALPSPDGKLHSRPFTRKRKAENPSSGGHVLLKQEEGMHTEKPDGQLPCNQLPLAAIAPSAEHDEWRNTLTSADSSLDVSATLQQAFLITDTGKGVPTTSGFRLADMVSIVAANCGLSRSAIWGASAQQQKLCTCIEQTVEERCQLLATEPAPPWQAPPAAEPAMPISFVGNQQALPNNRAVSEAHNRDTAQVPACCSGKAIISDQKPAEESFTALPRCTWPVAPAFGNPIITEAKAVPCSIGKLGKFEPWSSCEEAPAEIQGTDAMVQSKDGLAAEQPITEFPMPAKRLRLMSAVPPKAASTACKQEETQAMCSGKQAHNTKAPAGVRCPPSISASCGPLQQVPPQKPRSKRPHSGSSVFLRSQGGKDANSIFHSAAASAEATANTAQPKALRRLLESMKRSNWGAHRSIKQLNIDYRSLVNYKPQSGCL